MFINGNLMKLEQSYLHKWTENLQQDLLDIWPHHLSKQDVYLHTLMWWLCRSVFPTAKEMKEAFDCDFLVSCPKQVAFELPHYYFSLIKNW